MLTDDEYRLPEYAVLMCSAIAEQYVYEASPLTFFKKGDRSSPRGPRTYSVHLCVQYSVACSSDVQNG